ncbi:MAG: MogA/MoaB family molybdenum cofactor biosynthesis protein [Syntrophales bacterium]|jgi:molybdenum cofactor synthesis domain-containing protein|nr:MogA/MoaB family molybdenum cofactor biosynthesis protein [Syntrophales bacterium]MCK9527585.1 MogA/MoaB family molybdenum cofactor biosynthesis protein [Syntrophales bacterium]MDX9922202.1 MogA/MoaB family molybdenum cofactor biosynthesis protein [Syntrophales bacterium]
MTAVVRAGVITVSDRGSRGEREDISGNVVRELLEELPAEVAAVRMVADEEDLIARAIVELIDEEKLDLVVTTGGTGVSPRDVTPDATRGIIHREIPGMAEEMRRESLKKTPHAMISRAIVGIRNQSIIINLPGSPKGARENLSALMPSLMHALEKVRGDQSDCAS